MFWYLLLAHFIGDYPLQPYWMVRYKTRSTVRLLHVSIHFVVMLALSGSSVTRLWPYLLALAGIHFFIDTGKNIVNTLRPDWVIGPYVIDQMTHYLSIGLVAAWIDRTAGSLVLPLSQNLVVFTLGYLLATYVWYISERIFTSGIPAYQEQVIQQSWSRMLVRASLLSALLFGLKSLQGHGWIGLSSHWSPVVLLFGSAIHLPYASDQERGRAILTDILVSLAMAILVLIAS